MLGTSLIFKNQSHVQHGGACSVNSPVRNHVCAAVQNQLKFLTLYRSYKLYHLPLIFSLSLFLPFYTSFLYFVSLSFTRTMTKSTQITTSSKLYYTIFIASLHCCIITNQFQTTSKRAGLLPHPVWMHFSDFGGHLMGSLQTSHHSAF